MTCLYCKRSWRNNYRRRGFKVHLQTNIQARPQRNQGVGIIYRQERANADGKIPFPNSLDPRLPFQFLQDIFSGCKENHFYSLPFRQAEEFPSPDVISNSPKPFWRAELISQFFCYPNSPKNITSPSGKLQTEFTCPIAKSTSPGYGTLLSLHAVFLTKQLEAKSKLWGVTWVELKILILPFIHWCTVKETY